MHVSSIPNMNTCTCSVQELLAKKKNLINRCGSMVNDIHENGPAQKIATLIGERMK